MTRDEALLLAVANNRGLVTLTDSEAGEVSCALALSASDLRHALAASKVARLQQLIASADSTAPDGLAGDIEDLKQALDHQREIRELVASDRGLPARTAARLARAKTSDQPINAILDMFVAAGSAGAA